MKLILNYILGPTQRKESTVVEVVGIQQENSRRKGQVSVCWFKMILRFACSPKFCILSPSHTPCGVCVWDFVSGTIWSSVGGCWPCRPTQHNSLSLTHFHTKLLPLSFCHSHSFRFVLPQNSQTWFFKTGLAFRETNDYIKNSV